MSKIEIRKVGITEVGTEAIVNAANEGLWAGTGVCGAIFEAAGHEQLQAACDAIGHCDTGSAVLTPGFSLCKYIVHAVGPQWGSDEGKVKKQLYSCYQKALQLAVENGCKSIGFPLISAGIFGVPVDIAWRKALQACMEFGGDIQVVFAIPGRDNLKVGQQMLDEMQNKPKNMDVHEERIAVFNDTLTWIESDADLAASVDQAKKHTEIFWEDDYPDFVPVSRNQQICVTTHRSYEAAMHLRKVHPDAKIAVMNFANAYKPGGGVTSGAGAQEESLCRCSTLYPLLYRNTLRYSFYKHNKEIRDQNQNAKATDSMIYTEGVVICKTDDNHPVRMAKEDWVTVDVMTIAAPDLRKKSNQHAPLVGNGTFMNDAELFGYHVKRAIHMLTAAASKGANVLVLGAFGCGAFENNPKVVARAYRTALEVFPKVFDVVEFAIGGKTPNYDAFHEELGTR